MRKFWKSTEEESQDEKKLIGYSLRQRELLRDILRDEVRKIRKSSDWSIFSDNERNDVGLVENCKYVLLWDIVLWGRGGATNQS